MPLLVLGVVAFGALVLLGRYARVIRVSAAWPPALFALLAAGAAVAVGLRGAWIASLVLVALSVWMGRVAAKNNGPVTTVQPDVMCPNQARAILGVGADADPAQIEAAWRKMMLRAHPDHGGSSGLAAQINAARDCLLKKI
jgi:hypothetical protein